MHNAGRSTATKDEKMSVVVPNDSFQETGHRMNS